MQKKLIWGLFFLGLVIFVVDSLSTILGMPVEANYVFKLLILGVPIVHTVLHATYTLGKKRGIAFLILAAVIGQLMEMWGLRDGVIFGGNYLYNPSLPSLFSVPIQVTLFWAVFVYTGYCIVNAFVSWTGFSKPHHKNNSIFSVIGLVALDALIVTIIDVYLDPIQVHLGTWKWIGTGPYFGIPTGNFIGWFIVVCLITGVFRVFEYLFPLKHHYDEKIYIVSVLVYLALALSFTADAFAGGFYSLILIGLSLMLPIVISNIILFYRRST